jgi:hypothetical protein
MLVGSIVSSAHSSHPASKVHPTRLGRHPIVSKAHAAGLLLCLLVSLTGCQTSAGNHKPASKNDAPSTTKETGVTEAGVGDRNWIQGATNKNPRSPAEANAIRRTLSAELGFRHWHRLAQLDLIDLDRDVYALVVTDRGSGTYVQNAYIYRNRNGQGWREAYQYAKPKGIWLLQWDHQGQQRVLLTGGRFTGSGWPREFSNLATVDLSQLP